MATVKVPAHTRKDGTKVKAYSYTTGGKKKKDSRTPKAMILNKDIGRYIKKPGSGPKKGPSKATLTRLKKMHKRFNSGSRRPLRITRSKA